MLPLAEFPPLSQSSQLNETWTLVASKGKKAEQIKKDPKIAIPNSSLHLTRDELLHNFENVCYSYNIEKCKFRKECKKDHQKFCQKFVNYGPIKSNPKGCDGKCDNLHPITCRDAVKNRECARDKCWGQSYKSFYT